ncbi:MAG: transglycosylase SLT domain-containing protein [Myxococcales bacterium]
MPAKRVFALALLVAGAVLPQEATASDSSLARLESGGEDAAPAGLVSRASGHPDHPRTLEEIRKSGYIRILTRNNDTSFFIYRGHRMGFDYEVGKRLAQRLGIRADMVITSNWGDMVPQLLRGEGDVIAAEVTVTQGRKHEVLFATQWGRTREVVVYRSSAPRIADPSGLAGKEIHVRRSSAYFETLTQLSASLEKAGKQPIRIRAVPEDWETDTVLAAVSRGEILYTVADGLIARLHAASFDGLAIGPPLTGDRDLAWAVRPGDARLKREIDAVFRDLRRKPDFNVLHRKYFEEDRTFQEERRHPFYASETGTLSPYDAMVRRYAGMHAFDWRLVAAQIYQESHFDPRRESWAGASGLFQLMPATAKGLGVRDPTDPEQSIRAGLDYMQKLHDHYKDVPDGIERYRFALAAYNTGSGHVDDARRLARRERKDAKKWREVAPYLLRLSQRKYASHARFGFCRGREPVDYVRHIDERYAGYAQLVPP